MNILTRYPWPVINDGDSIMVESYTANLSVDADSDVFSLRITHKLNSQTIKSFIKNGKAKYVTEISCVATNYREAELSETADQEIIIASQMLRGIVLVRYYILSVGDIQSYTSPNFHTDYKGTKFDLNVGSVLAITIEDLKFDAKKRYAGSVSMSSYLTFEALPELNGNMYVNINEDQIVVNLPLPVHNTITGLLQTKTPDINAIVDAAYAYPAILFALTEAFDEQSTHESKFWYQCVKNAAEEKDIEWDRCNLLQIVQAALKSPSTRAAEALSRIVAPKDDDN